VIGACQGWWYNDGMQGLSRDSDVRYWDTRDNRGREVPHGVYFYRLDTKGFRDVKKAVVSR
jgi:hypothetical protein